MKNKLRYKVNLTRIFSNKKFVVAFSLILSFSIWLSVVINENPVREREFKNIKLNISVENTITGSLGLGIISDVNSQSFVVTVSGPSYIVSSLSEDDFLLSADISSITSPGTYSLHLECSRNSSKSGYDFKSVSPSQIDVKFDYIDTKELTIAPKLTGVKAADGLYAESPVVTNADQSTITIKGPREVVEKVDHVRSYAEVNKTLSATETFTSYVILYTADDSVLYKYLENGAIVDGSGNTVINTYLTLSFTSLKVTQPISKKATLNVVPTFENMPEGLSIDDINYRIDGSKYKKVTVMGPPTVIEDLENISLSAIDFSDISVKNNSFEVAALLKDGVKLYESNNSFTVDINTDSYAEAYFSVSKIVYKGLDASKTAKNESYLNRVKMCGPQKAIEELKTKLSKTLDISTKDYLYAVVDLSDYTTEGDFSVKVTVKSDIYKTVWQVGEYSLMINIS